MMGMNYPMTLTIRAEPPECRLCFRYILQIRRPILWRSSKPGRLADARPGIPGVGCIIQHGHCLRCVRSIGVLMHLVNLSQPLGLFTLQLIFQHGLHQHTLPVLRAVKICTSGNDPCQPLSSGFFQNTYYFRPYLTFLLGGSTAEVCSYPEWKKLHTCTHYQRRPVCCRVSNRML